MTSIAGPFWMISAILATAGGTKLVAPAPARRAIHAVGVAVPSVAVRALGAFELTVAAAAVAMGGVLWPPVVAVLYLGFAAFVTLMLRSGRATSCGCFGASSAPPSRLHVVINLAAAGVAFSATGIGSFSAVVDTQPWAGLPLVGLSLLGAYLLFTLLTALPTVMAPPQPTVPEFRLTPPAGR